MARVRDVKKIETERRKKLSFEAKKACKYGVVKNETRCQLKRGPKPKSSSSNASKYSKYKAAAMALYKTHLFNSSPNSPNFKKNFMQTMNNIHKAKRNSGEPIQKLYDHEADRLIKEIQTVHNASKPRVNRVPITAKSNLTKTKLAVAKAKGQKRKAPTRKVIKASEINEELLKSLQKLRSKKPKRTLRRQQQKADILKRMQAMMTTQRALHRARTKRM